MKWSPTRTVPPLAGPLPCGRSSITALPPCCSTRPMPGRSPSRPKLPARSAEVGDIYQQVPGEVCARVEGGWEARCRRCMEDREVGDIYQIIVVGVACRCRPISAGVLVAWLSATVPLLGQVLRPLDAPGSRCRWAGCPRSLRSCRWRRWSGRVEVVVGHAQGQRERDRERLERIGLGRPAFPEDVARERRVHDVDHVVLVE